MDKTMKQKFRQPFGYFMEHLIAKYFLSTGVFEMDHGHNHAYEWNIKLEKNDLKQLKILLDILNIDIEEYKRSIIEILKGERIIDVNSLEVINKLFTLRDNKALWQEKLILYSTSNLVASNHIEILRIEGGKLIVSEIKSQYGPNPDYRIQIEFQQINTLAQLTNAGIRTSLIYVIALPEPRFVEIPFIALYDIFNQYDDFNGKMFTTENWTSIRIRIPFEYRKDFRFKTIDKSLHNYKDENSLFNSILNEFPDKFNHLKELLN